MSSKTGFMQLLFPVIIAVVALSVGLLGGKFLNTAQLGTSSLSPNILSLTQPVANFSGVVESVGNNELTVSQQVLAQYTPQQYQYKPGASPKPAPKPKTITYTVRLTDKTQISQPPAYIPYRFKNISPAANPSTIDKGALKKGQQVNVITGVDLRTLSSNVFEAVSVQLPPPTISLNGEIVEKNENGIRLKAFVPAAGPPKVDEKPQLPQQKEFTITLTNGTEISQMPFSATPVKLSLSDLKIGGHINVYTAEDVSTTENLTALLVDVMPEVVAPSPFVSPSLPPDATKSAQ